MKPKDRLYLLVASVHWIGISAELILFFFGVWQLLGAHWLSGIACALIGWTLAWLLDRAGFDDLADAIEAIEDEIENTEK